MLLEDAFNKTYQITHDDTSGIIKLFYSGCVTFQDKLSAMDEICERFGSLDKLKILIDIRDATINLSLLEQDSFGKYLASLNPLRKAKTAVVHCPEFNPTCLIDAIAFNYGVSIAQFDSYNEAVQWFS